MFWWSFADHRQLRDVSVLLRIDWVKVLRLWCIKPADAQIIHKLHGNVSLEIVAFDSYQAESGQILDSRGSLFDSRAGLMRTKAAELMDHSVKLLGSKRV